MSDPTTRLITLTRRRLAGVTFGLVALLVVGIGAATAIAGLRALDDDVNRSLDATVSGAVSHLGNELPHDVSESDETAPASADTFVLYLDPKGVVTANPSHIGLTGLPDRAALAAMSEGSGRDLRTVAAGGVSIRLLTRPAFRNDGTMIGFVEGGFVLTLHDRQAASLVLTIIAVGLAGLVAAGVVTLLVTSRALIPVRRSFEAQRRFVADASHELRTPVALIRANAEVLEREGLLREGGRVLAQDIIAEADRLGRLVAELLEMASADARGAVLERTPQDLAALAAETARNASALAAQHGVTIVLDVPTAVPVSGARDRLIQLILILLDNAIRHSPEGGTVSLVVVATGSGARLTVTDQGPGVPAADQERIFEPFTRLPGRHRTGARGSGLGLAIGRQIAIGHGGEIGVAAAVGGGAVFTVTLPLSGVVPGHETRP